MNTDDPKPIATHAPAEGDAVRELRECIRQLEPLANEADHGADCLWFDNNCTCGKWTALAKARALLADKGREMGGEGN